MTGPGRLEPGRCGLIRVLDKELDQDRCRVLATMNRLAPWTVWSTRMVVWAWPSCMVGRHPTTTVLAT